MKHTLLSEGFFSLRLVVTTSVKGPGDRRTREVTESSRRTGATQTPRPSGTLLRVPEGPQSAARGHTLNETGEQLFDTSDSLWLSSFFTCESRQPTKGASGLDVIEPLKRRPHRLHHTQRSPAHLHLVTDLVSNQLVNLDIKLNYTRSPGRRLQRTRHVT